MEISVNGEVMTVPADVITVAALIDRLDIAHRKYFIIEKNREVVMKEDYATEPVRANDCFEIVHFVGGG
ncbi:sulfur carrier protein ThiS [Wohlfahrtiimonas chitiniclastica]|uniref:sulfur carrier protein ThiS n=1 Tax=Wohlfahrtiimonas chitiniclastica TaxID=400946 RepID=UPI001BD121F1|nr:sulfur carrier protein ThiS [Wohlfahrtiimonas chitiniclastica]